MVVLPPCFLLPPCSPAVPGQSRATLARIFDAISNDLANLLSHLARVFIEDQAEIGTHCEIAVRIISLPWKFGAIEIVEFILKLVQFAQGLARLHDPIAAWPVLLLEGHQRVCHDIALMREDNVLLLR